MDEKTRAIKKLQSKKGIKVTDFMSAMGIDVYHIG
jgi:uncharacterized protein with GYD domain